LKTYSHSVVPSSKQDKISLKTIDITEIVDHRIT